MADTILLAIAASSFVGIALMAFFKWRARRARTDAWESFLIALSESLLSVHVNEPAYEPRWNVDRTIFGRYADTNFTFVAVARGEDTRHLEFTATSPLGERFKLEARDVRVHDIGHPLSRAWLLLGRAVRSNPRQRASA